MRKAMAVIYVAGPFRGKSHYDVHMNIVHAEALALKVWQMGAAAICPHLNTAHFQDAAPDEIWLNGDLELLSRCDAVIMTDNWERSTGATAERNFALTLNIPVFYRVEDLQKWLTDEWLLS